MAEQPAFEIDESKTYRATIVTDRGTKFRDQARQRGVGYERVGPQ